MNVHCALDDRVRRLRIHHVQQNVNHFIASDSENRSTQNLFCFCIGADFDETLCLTFFVDLCGL
jgi:tyrosine-protein phosphatase YwqE